MSEQVGTEKEVRVVPKRAFHYCVEEYNTNNVLYRIVDGLLISTLNPLDANFYASFRRELAQRIGVPVDRMLIRSLSLLAVSD